MMNILSISGGKDSTAMLLRLLEEGYPVDDIVFFDTGWEFPQIVDHVRQVEVYIGRKISILKPAVSFNDWMFRREVIAKKGPKKGQVHRIGNGWPSPTRRWCTREKAQSIDKYVRQTHGKFYSQYIGFAADEIKRTGCGTVCAGEAKNGVNRLYPLIYDWDMDEKSCLDYCYERGFDWGGLYGHFKRVSCFCCPLQRIGVLRKLRRNFPGLWSLMLKWDAAMPGHNRGFFGYKTVHDLDRRFAHEDTKGDLLKWAGLAA